MRKNEPFCRISVIFRKNPRIFDPVFSLRTKRQERPGGTPAAPLFLLRYKLHNIGDIARQQNAQLIDRVGGDILPVLDGVIV